MKTVSLETARQLKEAGFPQSTHFYWEAYLIHGFGQDDILKYRLAFKGDEPTTPMLNQPFYKEVDKLIASPTADEILDELPSSINRDYFWIEKKSWGYAVHIFPHSEWHSKHEEQGKTLADAAAKMYLYLKKEGLL